MQIEKVLHGIDRLVEDDLITLYGGEEVMANKNEAWRCRCQGSGDNDNHRYRCFCSDTIVKSPTEDPTKF